jgi:hypothetical protein
MQYIMLHSVYWESIAFYNLVNLHIFYYTIAGWAKKLDLVLWVVITQNKYANVLCASILEAKKKKTDDLI